MLLNKNKLIVHLYIHEESCKINFPIFNFRVQKRWKSFFHSNEIFSFNVSVKMLFLIYLNIIITQNEDTRRIRLALSWRKSNCQGIDCSEKSWNESKSLRFHLYFRIWSQWELLHAFLRVFLQRILKKQKFVFYKCTYLNLLKNVSTNWQICQ